MGVTGRMGQTIPVDVKFSVDALSGIMMLVITGVGFLIHVYSAAYMHEEKTEHYGRYFSYLNLFVFSMLLLVLGGNFVIMFIGWEGVGLASYLLIGFWYTRESANAAAIKAFVVNRVGDLGFMLGIFGTYLVFNTVSIPEILVRAPSMAGSTLGFLGYGASWMALRRLAGFKPSLGAFLPTMSLDIRPDALVMAATSAWCRDCRLRVMGSLRMISTARPVWPAKVM